MFAHTHTGRLDSWKRWLLIGSVGLLTAWLPAAYLAFPAIKLLTQWSLFAPLERAAIVVKLLSPLLSFVLASGWMWVLLAVVGRWPFFHERRATSGFLAALPAGMQHCQPGGPSSEQWAARIADEWEWSGPRLAPPPLFQLDLTDPDHLHQVRALPTLLMQMSRGQVAAEVQTPQTPVDRSEPPLPSVQEEETPIAVRLTLLGQVRAWVCVNDGETVEIPLHGGEHGLRLILLAAIAWKQGRQQDRDKLLEQVIASGRRRNKTVGQLGEIFDSAKRYLRLDLRRTYEALCGQRSAESMELDFFASEPGFYALHPMCEVSDLGTIDRWYQVIEQARIAGLLDEKRNGLIADTVVQACEQLIKAYTGDFLETLLEKFPEEFGSWVRAPLTRYRDRYLDALLLLAKYESALGGEVEQEEESRQHRGRAAQLFSDYAMHAIKTRWDLKLKFAHRNRGGKDGERVIRAERAIRRCVVELGKLGNPDQIDRVYLAFKERMSVLSEGTWKPDPDTEQDVAEAKRTTSAYRFAWQAQEHGNGRRLK